MKRLNLSYKIEGKNIFRVPPPNVQYRFNRDMLERDIEELMWKYGLYKLTVEASHVSQSEAGEE